MKRVDYFKLLADIFHFKTVFDEKGNEFVFFSQSGNIQIKNVNDRTELEALENHIHLLDGIKKYEFGELLLVAEKLGEALLNALKFKYPNKIFVVFVTVDLYDSFIIRFHQKWSKEEPYYNPADFTLPNSKVFMFEG